MVPQLGKSDGLSLSAAVGCRKETEIRRNYILKYFSKASPINKLISDCISALSITLSNNSRATNSGTSLVMSSRLFVAAESECYFASATNRKSLKLETSNFRLLLTPRVGFEPTTNRLHLSQRFRRGRTISSSLQITCAICRRMSGAVRFIG
jgi:hypothetical protein